MKDTRYAGLSWGLFDEEIQAGANLKITERPLYNGGVEGSLAKQS